MLGVLGEGTAGVGQIKGGGPVDVYSDSEGAKSFADLPIERGHRVPAEREGHGLAAQGVDQQLVVDEVEVDGEDRVVAHRPGGDPSTGQVERDVPPVVATNRSGQADLAHDLSETVNVSLVSTHSP